jgi:hypothetical protein
MKKPLIIFILFFSICFLYADGGRGLRPATSAEKDYAVKVITTILKALPESFAGFSRKEATEPVGPEDVESGAEKDVLQLAFSGRWINDEMESKANEKVQKMADSAGNDIANTPKMKANMKKKDEITAKMEQAAKINDFKEIERLSKQLEALSNEMDKDYKPVVNAMSDKKYQIDVYINVNELNHEIYNKNTTELKPVMGNKTYISHKSSDGDESEDIILIFMGNWNSSKDPASGNFILKLNRKNIQHTAVQSYVISIHGSRTYTQKFADRINFQLLKSVLH